MNKKQETQEIIDELINKKGPTYIPPKFKCYCGYEGDYHSHCTSIITWGGPMTVRSCEAWKYNNNF